MEKEKPDDIKLKQLAKRYQEKKKDIESVSNQLNETQNAENKNQLERQINRLYEELEKIDQEVEILKSSTPSTNTNRDFTKKPIPSLLPHLCDRTVFNENIIQKELIIVIFIKYKNQVSKKTQINRRRFFCLNQDVQDSLMVLLMGFLIMIFIDCFIKVFPVFPGNIIV
ncbi:MULTISPECIES: hypothetical protein [Nostocales]|uniref:Uncharacterized protein n=1 Tax=Dolichospermum flos-aquae UHCC 0037 TaxID=2590026 RepID=A0ACC7S4Z0_DOLFA|nr:MULTISPECIES: hypothetical protein [Nostocales]MBO1063817.1 hypothetical protein [Anabaena sp. 54]MTJ42557.1 hypothetical protein [Dolichospermum flos-aquae UHCC 0037]